MPVVLHSLFEEHISFKRQQYLHHLTQGTESYAEALTYFPEMHELRVGPERYLDEIVAAKSAVEIPIIASLNGSTLGGGQSMRGKLKRLARMPSN